MQPTADADPQWHSRWLAMLLDQHGSSLALYASQWTTAADDCVQEALVQLAGEHPPPENPVAWLYRVVKNRALNRERGERRRFQREQQAWQQRLVSNGNSETRRELLDAISTLPVNMREIVLLQTWGGLTFAEMAEVLGQPSTTIHRRYHEALTLLRKHWELPCKTTTKSE